MANSYAQIQKQIAELQAQAALIKQDEVAEVVAKIREAIEVYGLTADDLFGRRAGAKKSKPASKNRAAGTQYSDGAGKVWGGRGPRPQWLRDALAAGKQLADFAVGGAAPVNAAEGVSGKKTGARKAAKKSPAKKSGGIRFRDDQGNAWSGFGPKPGWLKAAIAAGKNADDFRA